MNDVSYYLRKGEKTIGPLAFARLAELREQGKILADSMVAENAKGPWMTFSALEISITPLSQTVATGFPSMDLGAFLPTSAPAPLWNPSHQLAAQTRNRTPAPQTLETEDASWFKRLFLPWAGENSQSRYGNLERYIAIYKAANRIGFLIWAVLLTIAAVISTIVYSGLSILAIANDRSDAVPLLIFQLLVGYVFIAFYFGLLHLAYIAFMALIDFVRLMIDIEANTRKNR